MRLFIRPFTVKITFGWFLPQGPGRSPNSIRLNPEPLATLGALPNTGAYVPATKFFEMKNDHETDSNSRILFLTRSQRTFNSGSSMARSIPMEVSLCSKSLITSNTSRRARFKTAFSWRRAISSGLFIGRIKGQQKAEGGVAGERRAFCAPSFYLKEVDLHLLLQLRCLFR